MQSTGMVRPFAKKKLQTPVDWDTHTHAHPAHTALGYANAGILAAGALLCSTPGQLLLDDDAHVRGMQGISNQF